MTPVTCIALLTLFTVAFLGWGFMQLLTLERHREQIARLLERIQAPDDAVMALVAEHAAERARLLQRIQAPDSATAEHTAQALRYEPPKVAAFDNDASFWHTIGVDPLADEVSE